MDRSLKWRTIGLILITIFAVCTLLPSFVPRGTLPTWFTTVFSNRMSWGLDLQGGVHLVYSIDLDKAVDDRAGELKRDLETRFAEDGVKGSVRTPAEPLGAVTVNLTEAAKRA
jgi:preprotein translocase subunit SecD